MSNEAAQQAEEQLAIARIRLGRRLRARREELRIPPREVATALRCTTQFLGDLERGTNSTGDPRLWVRLADLLQLDRARLLTEVWATRRNIAIALPDEPARRDALLQFVLELAEAELPIMPLGDLP